jgi:hypothetical protein
MLLFPSLTCRFAASSPASGRGEDISLLPLAGEGGERSETDEGFSS